MRTAPISLVTILLFGSMVTPLEKNVDQDHAIGGIPNAKHMTLKEQVEFAGQNLLNSLEPEKNYLPYWLFNEKGDGWFRPGDQHNIGRVWDALLRLEDATGFDIPKEVETGMLSNLWEYCDNPSGILLDHPDPHDARGWNIHSYRETMLAFNALVRFRNSKKAAKAGHTAIERMSKASTNLNQWTSNQCRNLLSTRPNFKKKLDSTPGKALHIHMAEQLKAWYGSMRLPATRQRSLRQRGLHLSTLKTP